MVDYKLDGGYPPSSLGVICHQNWLLSAIKLLTYHETAYAGCPKTLCKDCQKNVNGWL